MKFTKKRKFKNQFTYFGFLNKKKKALKNSDNINDEFLKEFPIYRDIS